MIVSRDNLNLKSVLIYYKQKVNYNRGDMLTLICNNLLVTHSDPDTCHGRETANCLQPNAQL